MSSRTCAWPVTSSTPIAVRTVVLETSDAIITVRRGMRSPRTPPIESIDTCASVHAANESPTAVALPWRSRIANATAIGARYVPTYEIARLANRSLKFLLTLLLRPAGEAAVRLPQRDRGAVHAHVLAGVRDLLLPVGDELLLGR